MDRERARGAVFLAGVAVYYAVYFTVFACRVKDYFSDVLRHFEFARRFLGLP